MIEQVFQVNWTQIWIWLTDYKYLQSNDYIATTKKTNNEIIKQKEKIIYNIINKLQKQSVRLHNEQIVNSWYFMHNTLKSFIKKYKQITLRYKN